MRYRIVDFTDHGTRGHAVAFSANSICSTSCGKDRITRIENCMHSIEKLEGIRPHDKARQDELVRRVSVEVLH